MICLSNSDSILVSPEEEKAVAARIRAARITVHGISTLDSNPFLKGLCNDSGGTFHRIATVEDVLAAFRKILISLISRYEIEFPSTTSEATQLTLRIHSKSGYGEATIPL
jgi:hypothetical protein